MGVELRKAGTAVEPSKGCSFNASRFLSELNWQAISTQLRLSCREAQIAFLLLQNRSENDVATELGISVHTVHSHLGRLYRKLAIKCRLELIVRVFAAYVELHALTIRAGASNGGQLDAEVNPEPRSPQSPEAGCGEPARYPAVDRASD